MVSTSRGLNAATANAAYAKLRSALREDLRGLAVAWSDGRSVLLEQVANVRYAAAELKKAKGRGLSG